MHLRKHFLSAMILLVAATAGAQVEDSNYIQQNARHNNVEINNYYNSTRLHFVTTGNTADAFNFFANNGLFTGVYLNYKWVTIGYGLNVPFTSRDNSVKDFKIYKLYFNNYRHGWGFAGSAEVYKGLLSHEYKNNYTPLDDVRYTSITTDFFHVTNANRYSYKAAQDLGERQLKSAGSVFYHIRPSYYALGLENNPAPTGDSTGNFLSDNPRWLSLIGTVGYGYNLICNKGEWIIGPRVETGLGALYQFGIEEKFKPSAYFRATLTTGYSKNNIYTYLSIETINTANFFASTTLSDDRLRLNLTAGYRLASLKKKIFGLL